MHRPSTAAMRIEFVGVLVHAQHHVLEQTLREVAVTDVRDNEPQ